MLGNKSNREVCVSPRGVQGQGTLVVHNGKAPKSTESFPALNETFTVLNKGGSPDDDWAAGRSAGSASSAEEIGKSKNFCPLSEGKVEGGGAMASSEAGEVSGSGAAKTDDSVAPQSQQDPKRHKRTRRGKRGGANRRRTVGGEEGVSALKSTAGGAMVMEAVDSVQHDHVRFGQALLYEVIRTEICNEVEAIRMEMEEEVQKVREEMARNFESMMEAWDASRAELERGWAQLREDGLQFEQQTRGVLQEIEVLLMELKDKQQSLTEMMERLQANGRHHLDEVIGAHGDSRELENNQPGLQTGDHGNAAGAEAAEEDGGRRGAMDGAVVVRRDKRGPLWGLGRRVVVGLCGVLRVVGGVKSVFGRGMKRLNPFRRGA